MNAHNNTPAGKDKGNPKNWAWNPVDWFKSTPGNPNPTGVVISGGFNPGGGGFYGSIALGDVNGQMPSIGYHSNQGLGMGYYYNGNSYMYYPSYENRVNNAIGNNVNAAENHARDSYCQQTSGNSLYTDMGWYERGGIIYNERGMAIGEVPVKNVYPEFSVVLVGRMIYDAVGLVSRGGIKIYSDATYKSFERQLSNDGMKSILKTQTKIQKNLLEHTEKLKEIKKAGGYSSSVEREIKTFRSQLKAIEDLLKTTK